MTNTTSNIELTNSQKGRIWNMIAKYDSYVDKGFSEYKEFSNALNSVLMGDSDDETLMSITKFMDWDSIGKTDFRVLESTVGVAIDEMFFAM